jgi:hypothetical protein
MFNHDADTVFILGAGFSKESGLPVTSEFADSLLDPTFAGDLDTVITGALEEFLKDCFRWTRPDPLPTFEDMFTMIDLSAGSGHNIGRSFTPKRLRAIRRMLIYRLFAILDRSFHHSENTAAILNHFVGKPNRAHFVVLNWDIVLEKYVNGCFTDAAVDYCADISGWHGAHIGLNSRTISVAKIHGSANWVYCDNCRSLFFDPDGKLALHIRAGIQKADFRLFDEGFSDNRFDEAVGLPSSVRDCRRCQSAVGSHIATFSLRKSFRTHGFTSSWLAAEQMLTKAKNWVFLGYSLPDADFEFKNLLKTCQLKWSDKKKYPKEITVVTCRNNGVADRFRAFLGRDVHHVYETGIAGYAGSL